MMLILGTRGKKKVARSSAAAFCLLGDHHYDFSIISGTRQNYRHAKVLRCFRHFGGLIIFSRLKAPPLLFFSFSLPYSLHYRGTKWFSEENMTPYMAFPTPT